MTPIADRRRSWPSKQRSESQDLFLGEEMEILFGGRETGTVEVRSFQEEDRAPVEDEAGAIVEADTGGAESVGHGVQRAGMVFHFDREYSHK